MNIPAPTFDPLDAADRHVVTASDLVRHFGTWQDRASRAPVYILHRGRPRHVLTSVDVMQALCAPHEDQQKSEEQQVMAALLDLIGDIVILCDEQRVVTALSQAARIFFAGSIASGTLLDRVATPATAPFLADAARRVLASGAAEQAEIATIAYPARRLDCRLMPYPGGLAVTAHDASLIDDLAQLRAADLAHHAALAAIGAVATARISLRGYVDMPSPTLAAMTGLSADSLASARFVSLLEIGSRVAISNAIDALLAEDGQRAVDALMLVNRADPVPVRIGLSSIRQGAAITGLAAAIARAHDEPTPTN